MIGNLLVQVLWLTAALSGAAMGPPYSPVTEAARDVDWACWIQTISWGRPLVLLAHFPLGERSEQRSKVQSLLQKRTR